MDKQIVGRFAPSPSGRMHLGNVLCALLAWLSVRSRDGKYILRIEDLDPDRCPRHYADLIEDDLRWLGLDWDEGGSMGGPDGSYYQSERTTIYQHYFDILEQKGLIYPCFCSRAALHAASAPHLSDGRVIYAGTCRDMTADEITAAMKKRKPAARLRVPDRTIEYVDGVQGVYAEHLPTECGDYIIRRSDGVFGYQLAVVVDDALEGVNEVVRGCDLISSAPRQIWLHEVLGFEPPAFYHMPLLCASDGRRLSKRDEDLDLGLLREKFTPEQIVGALAHAAGLIDRPEPVTARELAADFRWERVPRGDLFLPAFLTGEENT